MKPTKKKSNTINIKDRILFFDVLKIAFIAIIVYDHSQFSLIPWLNKIFFSDGQTFFHIYDNGITGIAVYGVIFISGAVLEYNYKEIVGFFEYSKFLFKRFIRLYPAFWMSLIVGLVIDICLTLPTAGIIIKNNLFYIVFEYTGFLVALGKGPGFINMMGWFIAAIVSLYILFPYLSKIVKKYQLFALLAFLLVSFFSRSLLFTYNDMVPNLLWRWFPLCNLFEFGLGIYIMQNNFYPKNQNNYPRIHQLAELSFYVFLFHIILIDAMLPFLPTSGPLILGYITYFGMISIVLFVCWIVMITDKKIQQKIRQNEKVKNFIK